MKHIGEILEPIKRQVDWRHRFVELKERAGERHRYDVCQHAEWVGRRKVNSAGGVMYGKQCVRCGGLVGSWLKKTAMPDGVAAWDEGLSSEYRHESLAKPRSVQEARRREFFKLYNEYLASPEWKRIRNKVIARAEGTCEGCGEAAIAQVHHRTYDRVGWEMLFDLVGLCERCHDRVHSGVSRLDAAVGER